MVELWEVGHREDDFSWVIGKGKMDDSNIVKREARKEFGNSLRARCRWLGKIFEMEDLRDERSSRERE
jgi:hypothetical protein